MKKVALSLMLVALLGAAASAELLTYSGTEDGGYVLNDCVVNTDGAEWLSSIFYCELEDNSKFYQHPSYTGDFLWSYMDFGTGLLNPVDSWLYTKVKPFASGDELASLSIMSGDASKAAVSMAFIADIVVVNGVEVVPPWDGIAARFAFSPDAQGVWAFKVSAKGSDPIIYTGAIENGYMVPIPEPGTITLLLCGLFGLCVLRRK